MLKSPSVMDGGCFSCATNGRVDVASASLVGNANRLVGHARADLWRYVFGMVLISSWSCCLDQCGRQEFAIVSDRHVLISMLTWRWDLWRWDCQGHCGKR